MYTQAYKQTLPDSRCSIILKIKKCFSLVYLSKTNELLNVINNNVPTLLINYIIIL